MSKDCLVYLCNAIDERTCRERGITSDSPAATQKVIQISSALMGSKVRVVVLSLGRGGQKGSWHWHRPKVKRVANNVFVYGPFFDAPVLTHLVTLFGLLLLVWRLRGKRKLSPVLLAYNRLPHYMLALELSRWLRFRLFLDLEDGDVSVGAGLRSFITRKVSERINTLCQSGALLASTALAVQYPGQHTMCCYGVAGKRAGSRIWNGEVRVLLGGTLQQETGVALFVEAIELLRNRSDSALSLLKVFVTGKGAMAENIARLAREPGFPEVTYLGSVSRSEYRQLVDASHVGMCLKLESSSLGDTTFPSKVIEITSAGLLLLTTRVSDIPRLFSEAEVMFLQDESPKALAESLVALMENKAEKSAIATRGAEKIQSLCSNEIVGKSLASFFFSRSQDKQSSRRLC